MWNPETGRVERMTLSAKAIKTLKKLAIAAGKWTDYKTQKNTISQRVAGEGKHVKKEKKLTPKQKKELAKKEEEAKKTGKNPTEKSE